MQAQRASSSGLGGAGDLIHQEVVKIHQWKMNTKMAMDAKENSLLLQKNTLQHQSQELGKLQQEHDAVIRQYRVKCAETEQVNEELKVKTAQFRVIEHGVTQLKRNVDKQERVLVRAEKQENLLIDAVEELAGKYEKLSGYYEADNAKLKSALDEELEDRKRREGTEAAFKKEIAELDEKLEAAKTTLKSALDAERKGKKDREATESALRKEIDQLSDKLEKLQLEKKELGKACSAASAKLTDAERELAKKEDDIVKLDRDVAHFKSLRQRELKEKAEDLATLKEDFDAVSVAKEYLKKEMETKVGKLQEHLAAAEKDSRDAKAMVEKVTASLGERDAQVGVMDKKIAAHVDAEADLKKALSEAQKKLASVEEEMQEVSESLNTTKRATDNLESEVSDLRRCETELKVLRSDFAASLDTNTKAQDEIQKLRKYQVDNFTLGEAKSKLEKKMRLLQEAEVSRAAASEKEAKKAKEECKRHCEENKSLDELVSKLREQIKSKSTKDNELTDSVRTVENLKNIVLAKDKEIFQLESAQEFIVQEHSLAMQMLTERHDTDMRKKENAIDELKSKMEARLNDQMPKDLNDSSATNRFVPTTPRSNATNSSKSKSKSKRKLAATDSEPEEGGNLFDNFFSKPPPKKTYERKTPKRKFFKHTKNPLKEFDL